jgi:hypothetical protein
VAAGGRGIGATRVHHIVHAELEMPLNGETGGRLDHVLGREERHDVRRLVAFDNIGKCREWRDQNARHVPSYRTTAIGERLIGEPPEALEKLRLGLGSGQRHQPRRSQRRRRHPEEALGLVRSEPR